MRKKPLEHGDEESPKKEEEQVSLELWQIVAVANLLAGSHQTAATVKEISEQRLYTHSQVYGENRHHILTKSQYYNDLTIDQNDSDEKYQNRVVFEDSEFPPVLRQMLSWYLESVKAEYVEKPESQATVALGDDLGKLDDQPF